jgi:glycyl-tRNA synthetase
MADENSKNAILDPLRAAVKQQGDAVRALKEKGASDLEVKAAVGELKARKKILEDKEIELRAPAHEAEAIFDRTKLEDLLKQRFFFDQSFSIYGGVQGLYDFGPMGCAIKANLLSLWRQFFVLEEQMLEVECSMLTPEPVFKASGHVDRFADYMVRDVVTGECFRADHLIEAALKKVSADEKAPAEKRAQASALLPQVDNMKGADLAETIKRYNMKSPSTGNELTEPQQFNLMFSTSIGPAGNVKGYLRPETAQGIFVNFRRLLEFNQGRMPFAAAQIGNSFRNEISPRSGLLRVREFTMAEIEHFLDPLDKSHPKFKSVSSYRLNLYSACDQMDGQSAKEMSIGDAVAQKLVANETLGYFLSRVHMFLVRAGLDPQRLRFRQHMRNEMAHYACDCWDAECLVSYGWVEIVGCADRSAYDLSQHTRATGQRLVAERSLAAPKLVDVVECVPNRQLIGKSFKQASKDIIQQLCSLSNEELDQLDKKLAAGSVEISVGGSQFTLTKEMLEVKRYSKNIHVEEFIPNVIEPSFGIGRIMYCLFEHTFRQRPGDEQRTFLAVPAPLAPYKCSVLPLSKNADFDPYLRRLSELLTLENISHRVDDTGSGSIGRRYARTDQIAIPFAITVDFDTLAAPVESATVTLRERDSMKQIRAQLEAVPKIVRQLVDARRAWDSVVVEFPAFVQQETDAAEIKASKSAKSKI